MQSELRSDNETRSVDIQVPVFLTGIILREEISFCMDGANYRIRTLLGEARLKGANKDAEAFLDKVAGTRQRIAIAGYPAWGPECSYINVYYADFALEAMKRLGVVFA